MINQKINPTMGFEGIWHETRFTERQGSVLNPSFSRSYSRTFTPTALRTGDVIVAFGVTACADVNTNPSVSISVDGVGVSEGREVGVRNSSSDTSVATATHVLAGPATNITLKLDTGSDTGSLDYFASYLTCIVVPASLGYSFDPSGGVGDTDFDGLITFNGNSTATVDTTAASPVFVAALSLDSAVSTDMSDAITLHSGSHTDSRYIGTIYSIVQWHPAPSTAAGASYTASAGGLTTGILAQSFA